MGRGHRRLPGAVGPGGRVEPARGGCPGSLRQHGYAGVNVADICSAAGIAKGSFYRYFDSKEAIFLAAARSTVEAVGEQLDELPAPMSEPQAIEKLQLLLGPLAPLLLEVATGELRHQPNLVGVIGVITAGLAGRVVPRLRHARQCRPARGPARRRRCPRRAAPARARLGQLRFVVVRPFSLISL